MNNSKTYKSFDTSTVCPKRSKGKSCPYCYVESARKNGGFRAKQEIQNIPYDNWVLRLNPSTVVDLNAMGGIRMFSFSDYMPKHAKMVGMFLDDCEYRGLMAKVVTKVPVFLHHFHRHAAVEVVHLSVDSIGYGVPIPKARDYREIYSKVKIRAVCLSDEDLEYFGSQPWVDILTLNHGQNAFKRFTVKDRQKASERYPGRVCCVTSVCESCEVRCGVEMSVPV